MDDTIYKIALAGYFHDIGKFSERAHRQPDESNALVGGFYPDKQFLNDNMDLYQPHYQNKYTHKHAVYTAAFIDHLEKILPKQFNSAEWGLGDSFINLAAMHHKPETPLQWIIAMADRVSSGFERDEFESYNNGISVNDYKKTRLLTIFEDISTDGKWEKDDLNSYKFRYPLKELSPENIFPISGEEYTGLDSDQASKEYSDLFFNFVAALEKLVHKENVPLWFEHFDSLFKIFASHVPAATVGNVKPDVSLYDHSKVTSALASAIYLYHKQKETLDVEKIKDFEEKKFLIISSDFYGIQDFIFSEGGSTNKASAKLLRGRSFAVSLISELAADMLCKEIGLTTASVVLSAAGKFTIIASNTEDTKQKIKVVEEKINDWLIKNFYGESAMGISTIEASCSDFTTKRFPYLWDKLSKELERKKFHKIDLEKYGGAVKDYLDSFNNKLDKKICPFCGKRPSGDDPLLGKEKPSCKICRDHIYIGTNLVKASKIAVTTLDAEIHIHDGKLCEPIFGTYQISLDVDGKLTQLAQTGKLLKYWDISISEDGTISKEITAKFINGYVPKYTEENDMTETMIGRLLHGSKTDNNKNDLFDMIHDGLPKTFNHLAKMALNEIKEIKGIKERKFQGLEALGVLKADVDNLGLIFTCGLRNLSISRLATLSRQMNNYFSIYLPYMLKTTEKFKDIYTVFAGGDDLFLIGPWNKIMDFALSLNDSFHKYVSTNNQITISAGISINKPGEPVLSIAERAEEALKKSKNGGRNSITVFEETVKWSDFIKLEEIKKVINEWLDKRYINNAMLFRLNSFSDMAKQEKEIQGKDNIGLEEMECTKWHSKFKYNLVRNIGTNLKGEEKEQAIEEVEKAAEWLTLYAGAIKIPVWQIIYNRR